VTGLRLWVTGEAVPRALCTYMRVAALQLVRGHQKVSFQTPCPQIIILLLLSMPKCLYGPKVPHAEVSWVGMPCVDMEILWLGWTDHISGEGTSR
jgi:hypothetical protein